MPRKGKDFEKLIERIERSINPKTTKITSPAYLRDKDSGELREVDVLIEVSEVAHPLKISVECRDRNTKEDSTWIEQLSEKRSSLGLDKTIAVSKKSFSTPAQQKAQRLNILLLHLDDLPPNVEKLVLSGVLRIQHCSSDISTLSVELVPDESNPDILKKIDEEPKTLKFHLIPFYNSDGKLIGNLGSLINRVVEKTLWDEVEKNGPIIRKLKLPFSKQKHPFLKYGPYLVPVSLIEADVRFSIETTEQPLQDSILKEVISEQEIAHHSEATFSKNGHKFTFSLTKSKDQFSGQIEFEKEK